MRNHWLLKQSQKSIKLIFLCLAGVIFGDCNYLQQTSASEFISSTRKVLQSEPTPKFAPSLVMRFPKKIATPLKIKKLIKDKITETRTVDFNGDGKLDYLVFVKTVKKLQIEDEAGTTGIETWITSGFKIVKREQRLNSAFHDRWFINLDDDPMPEVFYALLYEDSSEYSIYKQNFNGKDKLLFNLNPVISDATRQNKNYWGFAGTFQTFKRDTKTARFKFFVLWSINLNLKTMNLRQDKRLYPSYSSRGKQPSLIRQLKISKENNGFLYKQ